MSKPKECVNCQKPATIHLTQIVENKIYKVDLCEDCKLKGQFADDLGLESFSQLAMDIAQGAKSEVEIEPCPSCGCTQTDLQKTGRFGCPDCYDSFQPLLNGIFHNIQAGQEHTGKIPHGGMERQMRAKNLRSLRRKLEAAIREERYEDAALVRDELKMEEASANQN